MEEILRTIYYDINSTEVTLANSVFKLVLSMVLGVLVGVERKRKGQIAGVRTFALISMGRIAAQVITGVGFLGGGAMIHMKGSVRGLTTAAGIWMTATIGMAVGVGMYWCSILATGLILVTLVLLEAWEHRRNIGHENRVLKLQVEGIVQDIEAYREVFNRHKVHLSTYFIEYDYERDSTQLNFVVLAPSHRNYLPMFQDLRVLGRTKSLTLTSQA